MTIIANPARYSYLIPRHIPIAPLAYEINISGHYEQTSQRSGQIDYKCHKVTSLAHLRFCIYYNLIQNYRVYVVKNPL